MIGGCEVGTCIDDDEDGICRAADNCPQSWNPGQADCDDNGIGDICDENVAPRCLVLVGGIVSVGGGSSNSSYVLQGGGGSVPSGSSENANYRVTGGVTNLVGP